VLTAHVVVRNPLGLHARPAAVLARSMAGFDAQVQVDGVNAASVLELMKLGATQGRELTVSATGPQARVAVDAFVAAVEEGFGEV
jgi:PTS hybrid protein